MINKFYGKKGIFISTLILTPYVIALAMQIFFAKKLSVEEVGAFAIISIFLSSLMALSYWGADKYIISKASIQNSQIDEIFTFELTISFIIYLFILILCREMVNDYLGIQQSNLFWLAMAFVACYFPLSRVKAILEKDLQYILAYSPIFIANIAAACIGVICVYKGFGLYSMLIWKVSIYFIEIIILYFNVARIPRIKFSFIYDLSFLKYCSPIFFGGLIGFMTVNADKVLLKQLMGPRELGIFWLAFTFSHIPLVLREVLSRILLPILSKLSTDELKLLAYDKLNGILQVAGVIFSILLTYWSGPLFSLVLGEKWIDAVPIFIILFYAALLKLICGSVGTLLLSVMRTKQEFYVPIIYIFIFLPIMYFFIKFGGLMGAAMGVLVSIIFINVLTFETFVRNFSKKGFLYYLSYLLVNVISVYLIYHFFIDISDGYLLRLFLTLISIVFAIITLPINNILRRAF